MCCPRNPRKYGEKQCVLYFSVEQSAFYYARVLENPTCRWTTELANSADKDLPDDLPATVQERGWSSPIWSRSQ